MSGLRIIATFGALFVVSAGLGAASLVGLVAQKLGLVPMPRRRSPYRYASRALRIEAKR